MPVEQQVVIAVSLALGAIALVGFDLLSVAVLVFLVPFAQNRIELGCDVSIFLPLTLCVAAAIQLRRTRQRYRGTQRTPLTMLIRVTLVLHAISLLLGTVKGIPHDSVFLSADRISGVANFSSYMVASVLLAWMVSVVCTSHSRLALLLMAFQFSLLVLALMVAAGHVLGITLPEALKPFVSVIDGAGRSNIRSTELSIASHHYFSGYHGSIENFSEYLFIVLALSLAQLTTPSLSLPSFPRSWRIAAKLVPATALLLSFAFAIPTASRGYVFMVTMFAAWFVLHLRDPRQAKWVSIACIAGVLVLAVCVTRLSDTFLFERLVSLADRGQAAAFTESKNWAEEVEIIMGRDGLFTVLPKILATGGLLGGIPLVLYEIQGSLIPYHNGFYQVILNYGIVGLCLLLRYMFATWRSIASMRKTRSLRNGAVALTGLFVILMAEQVKVSILRNAPSAIALYFLFAVGTAFVTVSRRNLITVRRIAESSPHGDGHGKGRRGDTPR